MTKLVDLNSLKELNYEKLGLKCGIEIHQQLNTGKLFSSKPCKIFANEDLDKVIYRKLRFSQGEGGSIDVAALNEFKQQKIQEYRYNDECAGLVELDEEPPHEPNKVAIETAIKVGQMMNVIFFDKVQFMRKIIVDGSITSGFQRTAMLGANGYLISSYGRVEINAINIEEDSSRIIERSPLKNIFSLDRQGIPLIEITTGPQIKSPIQAQELARELGNILRSFQEIKRGLGTIRQDLNISIKGGKKIEIKGAQNLNLLPEIIDDEIRRQIIHLSIISEVKSRGIEPNRLSDAKIYDLSNVFGNTTSKVLLTNLEDKQAGVYGIKLRGFKGILGHEMQKNYRFATEVSKKNQKLFPQVKGLFHSDELPKYGITEKEVEDVRKEMKIEENDSFILVAQNKNLASDSLRYILSIIIELISSMKGEVRQVDPKGTKTLFLRPTPGSARMYPETDVEEKVLTPDYLESLKKQLPERYEERLDRLSKKFLLDKSKVQDLVEKYSENQITELIRISQMDAKQIYSFIFDLPKDIRKRDNVIPIDFSYSLLNDILKLSSKENLTQKTIRDIFLSLYKDRLSDVESLETYLNDKKLIKEIITGDKLKELIVRVIKENPKAPFGALMGIVMKESSGNVDGREVKDILSKLL